MLRVLFLVADARAVSARFRVFQYLAPLRAAGVAADVGDLRAPLAGRMRVIARAAGYDAVVVHRALLSPPELWWLRRMTERVAFDFDDAILFRDSAAARLASRRRRRRFARMVRGAAHVVAGNAYLADWARRCGGGRVAVVPTAVDLDAYPAEADAGAAEPIVGWMGTGSNLMYLWPVLPALRAAATRAGGRVTVVTDADRDRLAADVEWRRWSSADEVDDLRRFRVGVMPLADDAWTRGKCALKIVQYFAARRPVVCSPVGANLELVEAGTNGYFATDPAQWGERVAELIGDPQRCRRFGAHGRALVEARYSVAATLPAWLEVITALTSGRGHRW